MTEKAPQSHELTSKNERGKRVDKALTAGLKKRTKFLADDASLGLVELGEKARLLNLGVVKDILGVEHPYYRHCAEKSSTVKEEIALTEALWEDTLGKWGRYLEVDDRSKDTALRNLVGAEEYRNKYVESVDKSLVYFDATTFDPCESVPVTYQAEDDPSISGTTYFSKGDVDWILGDTERTLKAYKDSGVPFTYLFAGDLTPNDKDIQPLYSTFREVISKGFPSALDERYALDDLTRGEMRQLEFVIFEPSATQFAASYDEFTRQSMLLVPLSEINTKDQDSFKDELRLFVLPNFSHELTHVEDFRAAHDITQNGLLREIRGICAQQEYLERTGHDEDIGYVMSNLQQYTSTLNGVPNRQTHIERFYMKYIKEQVVALPDEEAEKVIWAL